MNDLRQLIDYVVLLYCDNQLAMHLTENLVFYIRTKHVEVHYHFVKEKVLLVEVELPHIKIDKQVAGLFTKNLSAGKFVNIHSQHQPN